MLYPGCSSTPAGGPAGGPQHGSSATGALKSGSISGNAESTCPFGNPPSQSQRFGLPVCMGIRSFALVLNPAMIQQASDQRSELFDHIDIKTVTRSRPLDFASHHASRFEYLQMLADSRLRQRQGVNQLAANTSVDLFQASDKVNPRRMPQRLAKHGQTFGILLQLILRKLIVYRR
jgi:hypothetical protein